ncbi:MAG: carbamate kinase [Mogibacterium sp.]|jgi:carbamate kinase|nr:carbamate kinase [Mogibacterium sp.]MBQ3429289.1 carbamate kinase [Mogibacterium sp.]MBR3377378.1 carbamate kinase [Mogibacterium sp.]
MANKKIVVALGGNALGSNLVEQMISVTDAVKPIADLVEDGYEVVVTHGNGPQVGVIQDAMTLLSRENPEKHPHFPLSVCTAMSQGYIGYDVTNKLREELLDRGINKGVSCVLTQVEVDPDDPAFQNPTKPIGPFLTKEEAEAKAALRNHVFIEDSGRGYRRVVASPEPISIIEIDTIRTLADAGYVVIGAGGGGIPVFKTENHHLKGAPAVIDKDRASELLAEELDADFLIILTAVEKAAINFNKPDQQWLDDLTPDEARKYIAEGQFAPGSMLPKIEAAVKFAESKPGRVALITLLEKAKDGINGKTGTRIHA